MTIVNTTFVIEDTLVTEVKKWIADAYEASAYRCGANPERTLRCKVLFTQTPNASTYALHLCFADTEAAQHWCEGVGKILRERASDRWGERVLTFHTYLEVE